MKNFLENVFFSELDSLSELLFLKKENCFFFETAESTNTYLKEKSSATPNCDMTLVFAETQTRGRGRLQRSFYSPSQKGLYFSIYAGHDGKKNPGDYTVSAAVAVTRAIESLFSVTCMIKWVNDIYINERKICGILTEAVLDDKTNSIKGFVIGIGINIFKDENVPEELKSKIGSITQACEKNTIREKLLARCVFELHQAISKNEIPIEEYRKKSFLTGRHVKVIPIIDDESTSYNATVEGISDNAELIVKLEDGSIKRISTGEVSVRFDN